MSVLHKQYIIVVQHPSMQRTGLSSQWCHLHSDAIFYISLHLLVCGAVRVCRPRNTRFFFLKALCPFVYLNKTLKVELK